MFKHKITQQFNKAVNTYDAACDLQLRVGTNLIERLRLHYPSSNLMLDLGCGSGLITEKLTEEIAFNHLYAVDMADQLLSLAKKRLAHRAVHFACRDFNTFSDKNNCFDLVFSNMALHWSPALNNALANIYRQMDLNGWLAFSIPLSGTFSELTEDSRNHFYTEQVMLSILTQLGFICVENWISVEKQQFPSWLTALKSIKQVGASHVQQRKWHSLSGNDFIKRLVSGPQIEPARLTYRIGYFIVRKNGQF
ncbi:MAG TPA: methyltransferase domain-containing protein [Gammaproteobacteria bacterium]|jgi:malonyl-CoA O-methyltransferase|nr:methyltransferase domain-containing protein [Gammaproteobacteria bacterium]